MGRVVHVPTVTKMIRDLRGKDMTSLTPANETLMFSIYYAAVTSMEEEDVSISIRIRLCFLDRFIWSSPDICVQIIANFGCTKTDLNLKYRLGFEHALARSDFLNVPSLVLIQALITFLFLVRRHDSPRYVWMMTGLVIRMVRKILRAIFPSLCWL